jgi:hypothetical protein
MAEAERLLLADRDDLAEAGARASSASRLLPLSRIVASSSKAMSK